MEVSPRPLSPSYHSLATELDFLSCLWDLTDLMATAVATVAPENWKEASIRTIKLAQTIINKSDRGIDDARETDPLPLIREVCMRESNEKVHAYVRQTRAVVAKMREQLQATNEQIKSLNRGKEGLEKALEHKRKDLALNVQSYKLRDTRPQREKVGMYRLSLEVGFPHRFCS